MKKKRKIGIQKSAIKKVAQSGSQGIKKRVIAKRERGITLIALVVTIIIMLILAAVTLNMALGDNGLIQMAKFTTNKYEQAAINESLAMQELEEAFPKTAKDLTKDNYGDYVDYKLDLNDDGDTTNDWRIFYVGDVPKDEEGGTEEGSGKTEKRVFLIAADYVPNECDALQAAQTSEHANMKPSTITRYNICSSCWSDVSSVIYHCNDGHNKGLNSGKEQCSFPEVFMTNGDYCGSERHYYCSDHVGDNGTEGNINSRCASSLQCTGNWKPFVEKSGKGYCANYAIGGPTLEMWVASWNQKHGENVEDNGKTLYANGKSDSGETSGYYVGTSDNCTTTSYDLSGTEGYSDTLYFPHKTSTGLDLFNLEDSAEGIAEVDSGTNENASCWGYLLSSPSANNTGTLMQVLHGGSVSTGGYRDTGSGVRPVVSLKSNVKLTKNNSITSRVVYDIDLA